jgi:signal transduction histidine kinase
MKYLADILNPLKPKHLAIVSFLIIGITALHYSTMTAKVHYHTLYRDLYFIPILLMSFWYGLKVGVFTSLIVILLYLPHVFMTWAGQPGVNFGNLMQIFIFILVAVTMGYLSDREKKRQREVQEAKNLVSLGRASLGIAFELEDALKTLKDSYVQSSTPKDHELQEGIERVIDKLTILQRTASQFTQESMKHTHDVVEINDMALKVRRNLKRLTKIKGVNLDFQLDPAGCSVQMNGENLLWTLEELIKNAIEHSKPGQTVTVVSKRQEKHCDIRVVDQGSGISSEDLQKIFVPFHTTRDRGTGLGLPVCQKIIRDNGGEIQVESKVGEGSVFRLLIPQAYTNVSSIVPPV